MAVCCNIHEKEIEQQLGDDEMILNSQNKNWETLDKGEGSQSQTHNGRRNVYRFTCSQIINQKTMQWCVHCYDPKPLTQTNTW